MTSASPRLDKRRRTYVRLVGEIHHALNQALGEEKEKRGLNMTKIAKALGIGRSAVSRKFDGRHNMTLETLADLAFALDRPVKVTLPERIPAAAGSNQSPMPPTEAIRTSVTTTGTAQRRPSGAVKIVEGLSA